MSSSHEFPDELKSDPKSRKQLVYVIVPAFNGGGMLERFLSTFHDTTVGRNVLLLVVDNHSNDETVSLIRSRAPEAELICNQENRGYAGACNQGMKIALARGADVCILANQDIGFEQHWFEPLVSALVKDHTVGAAQPLILLYPETHLINSCGNALHYLGFGFTRDYRRGVAEYSAKEQTECAYCSGALVAYSSAALSRVGLFDESYFMYHEDTDLSWRMRSAGYRTIVVPESRVTHEYEFSRSIKKFYFIERNRLLTLFRNYEARTLFLILPMLAFWEGGLLLYSLLGGILFKKTVSITEKIAVYGYFFNIRVWIKIFQARRSIASLRRVRDQDLVGLFSDRIEFQDIQNPLLDRLANPIAHWYWRMIKRFI